MSIPEVQDYIHVYSLFSFRGGRKEPGIMINKYNTVSGTTEYYFIPQVEMQAYKTAFEKYDRDTCARLCEQINLQDLIAIRPVTLSDYKMILQLLDERKEQLRSKN